MEEEDGYFAYWFIHPNLECYTQKLNALNKMYPALVSYMSTHPNEDGLYSPISKDIGSLLHQGISWNEFAKDRTLEFIALAKENGEKNNYYNDENFHHAVDECSKYLQAS